MRKNIRIIIGFMKKEFIQALRDPVMRLLIFLAPVIQLAVFGNAINNEIKNIKLYVILSPADSMARQLSDRFYSSGWFLPVENGGDADELLQSGKADAVLIMPAGGFSRGFGKGETKLQLLIDASNSTKAQAIERYSQTILQKFLQERLPPGKITPAINFDVRILYNPTMETSIFMVPGIMTQIMGIIIIILTSMALAKEKEQGTMETIIAAPISNQNIIIGKALPYMIIGIIDAIIILIAGKMLFDVPIRGSLLSLVLASIFYVISLVGIGLLISTIAINQQQAMMGSFMFIFPAIMLSGIIFPLDSMPPVFLIFSYLNPLYYYARAIRNVMLKGANPELVLNCTFMLAILGTVVIMAAIARFKQKLN